MNSVIDSKLGLRWLLFLFALSFAFFAIQSGDVLMYLTLARDFLVQGRWPEFDPYLYSLPHAPLQIAHEYLSYLMFYGAWQLAGFAGLIFFKMLILSGLFWVTLRASPRANDSSPLWMALWVLAVLAGSFRFIERSSLFSDLFCVLLLSWLIESDQLSRNLLWRLSALFLLWVQLHPGYPIGLLLLIIWSLWHWRVTPGFQTKRLAWLALPVCLLLLNPRGFNGALYPFHFALNEATVLKHFNLEWFPTYHRAFRFTPEVLAFWTLAVAALCLVWRERSWLSLRAALLIFALACGTMAVRFVPWASFAVVLLVKPWAVFKSPRLPAKPLRIGLCLLMLAVMVKNWTVGYVGSSGPRHPGVELDKNFFPIKTLQFLRANAISGRLYNVHDFGSYLVWQGFTPIFHHGFVTDMNFYANDVVGVFQSQTRFLELAKKYGWTMLLVDKHGGYRYFYKILAPLTDWKIVAEDDASYLIYDLPETNGGSSK